MVIRKKKGKREQSTITTDHESTVERHAHKQEQNCDNPQMS